jgi:UDP-N-acetylmuramate dehydrogenase
MILRNHSLKQLNTFGFPVKAAMYSAPDSVEKVISLIGSGIIRNNNSLILGGGSNLLFTRDFDGIVINPLIGGIEVSHVEKNKVIVTAGAGVEWDGLADWSVSNGFGGTENLSLIPGHTGAVAVQNIGAYGAEAAEIVDKVYCLDIESGEQLEFTNNECRFGYRDSIFKGELKGRIIITSVSFALTLQHNFKTGYGALSEEVDRLGGLSLKNIRTAVISIRRSKLPDPAITGNAGSFFKNPVVPEHIAAGIKRSNPNAPCFDAGEGLTKIAAGWLIDQCGWKGYRKGDAGVFDKQALVLVNYGNATGIQIAALAEEIAVSVSEKFGVALEREVEII